MKLIIIFSIIILAIGLYLVASAAHSKTACLSLFALIFTMSFLTAFNIVSFAGGMVFTAIVSLAVIILDELRILS